MATLYQKIRHAASTASGMRLTPQDVRTLYADEAIRQQASADDDAALETELPARTPRGRRADPVAFDATQEADGQADAPAPATPAAAAPPRTGRTLGRPPVGR